MNKNEYIDTCVFEDRHCSKKEQILEALSKDMTLLLEQVTALLEYLDPLNTNIHKI